MTRNINTMQINKRNRRLCKVLSAILVTFMGLSMALFCVSARTNSWNLIVSQAEGSDYFYAVGNGGSAKPQWSVVRQNCFIICKRLTTAFNQCITEYDDDLNIIKILEWFYDNGQASYAVELGTKWNVFNSHVTNYINETAELVGYGESVPTVNGKEVTVEQYQNLYSRINTELESLNAYVSDVRSNYQASRISSDGGMSGALGDSGGIVNYLWAQLRVIVSDIGFGSGTTNRFLGITTSSESIRTIADSISGVTKTFAYAIAVVLFGVNITTTALQNEILTLRGGIKVFARVILVKIWIDLAIPICMYTLGIVNSLARQILTTLSASGGSVFGNSSINSSSASGWGAILKMVTRIFNAIIEFITGFPSLILIIIMIVCIVLVIIKLVARCFELTCLVSLSPIFFATLVGEESKRYFRKFMSAFLTTAGYIAYVAIVYAVGTRWVAQATEPNLVTSLSSLFLPIISTLPRAIIIIACCRVMVKPPKVLLSLTDGG